MLRYGFAETADVRAEAVVSRGRGRDALPAPHAGRQPRRRDPALGRLSVHNALAAAAVGLAAGLTLDAIVDGPGRPAGRAPHRDELVRLRGATSSTTATTPRPTRSIAALDLLAELPGRHVAVLGEMLELGDGHDAGHLAVGEAAAAVAELLDRRRRGRAAAIADGALAGRPRPGAHPPRRRRATTALEALPPAAA